jgi:nicotinate (nicotinamide) nucleotide adenylyltransferase
MKPRYHVYLGGSFFPPHVGHDDMLVALLAHPDTACVHLVPTFQNPLKQVSGPLEVSAEFKRRMIEAWTASLRSRAVVGLSKLKVEWIEVESGRTSYTYDTLSELQRSSGLTREDWVLCLGDDCLPDLEKWKQVEALLKSVAEVWVFRRGNSAGAAFLPLIPENLRSMARWRLLVSEIRDVSSTEVRRLLESSDPDAKRELPARCLLPELWALLG